MKKFLLTAILFAAAVSGSCSKDDGDNGNSPALPSLPDPNDVCSCMTNAAFMKYCYENFDLNGDGAISKTEAAAVVSIGFSLSAVGDNPAPLTGIEYFSNIQSISIALDWIGGGYAQIKSKIDIDLRYNQKLQYIKLNLPPSDGGEISVYLPETYEGNKPSDIGLTYCSRIYGKHASSDHRCWIVDGKLTDAATHGLTSYTIPDNVVSIGDYAFYGCEKLENVTIGNRITSIGLEAFNACKKLSTLYCKPATPPSLRDSFVPNIDDDMGIIVAYQPISKIYVPHSAVDAYKSADEWSEYANKIEGYDF